MTLAARAPPGYASLAVSSTQILLPLTISNKCGQSFRWRGVEVYDEWSIETTQVKAEEDSIARVKKEDEPYLPFVQTSSKSIYYKTMEWSICLNDRVVFVRQDEERSFIYHKTILAHTSQPATGSSIIEETAAWLEDYLNLRVPLTELYEEWSQKDEVFKRFAKRFTGVRMLRQDPWECLCAFICSSNNNIARIGQMVQNLCTHFSEPILTYTYPAPPCDPLDGNDAVQSSPTIITYHPFPSPERLAQPDIEEKLRELAFGYRARYIFETARLLLSKIEEKREDGLKYESVDHYLSSLRTMTYEEARKELLQFQGVGPKVADCILLMSMDQPSSIPVDRHVFQFAERWYKIKTKGGLKGYEHIADKFRALWGPYAGWAHSVLFTADLRAFATYKKEEEVKVEFGECKVEVKRENEQVKVEEEQSEPVFYDNGRPARRQQSRKIETTITETFPGIKRESSDSNITSRKRRLKQAGID